MSPFPPQAPSGCGSPGTSLPRAADARRAGREDWLRLLRWADKVSVEADRSPRFPGNPRGGPLGSPTPAGPDTPGRYGVPTRPPPVSRTWAPATKAFGAQSPSSTTSLSTLRSRGHPRTTQDSLPTAGRALSGGIGYPQGSDKGFPSCTRYISSPLSELAWRNDTVTSR